MTQTQTVDTKEPNPELRARVLREQEFKTSTLTLEKAAANANVRLGSGINYIDAKTLKTVPFSEVQKRRKKAFKNGHPEPRFHHQPFWFAYEQGERVVVYIEAEMTVITVDKDPTLPKHKQPEDIVFFAPGEAREALCQTLIGWRASRAMGTSLVSFAAGRGFNIKRAR